MSSKLYSEDHELFRKAFQKYVEREVTPLVDRWEAERDIPREAWTGMGDQGFLCPWLSEEYGGVGAGFLYSVIINEELVRGGAAGFQAGLHSDIIAPYLDSYGTPEQKEKWLPGAASGDVLLSVAMTEPDTGSDLQAVRTRADRDGDDYVINGQKTFISNGYCCDLAIVVCRTDPEARPAHKGLSLIAVEAGTPGFIKGRKLNKMGLWSADTSELIFEDCRVPRENIIGGEGQGFRCLMEKLQQERLVVAIQTQTAAEVMLNLTLNYCMGRRAFGKPIGSHQHNTFKLVEMATEVELGRTFIDDLIQDHIQGRDIVKKVSMAKWWIAEMANRLAYDCVQLHGGYGYMEEYPISRWYRDIRASSIYAGTSEIMKRIIGRMMGL